MTSDIREKLEHEMTVANALDILMIPTVDLASLTIPALRVQRNKRLIEIKNGTQIEENVLLMLILAYNKLVVELGGDVVRSAGDELVEPILSDAKLLFDAMCTYRDLILLGPATSRPTDGIIKEFLAGKEPHLSQRLRQRCTLCFGFGFFPPFLHGTKDTIDYTQTCTHCKGLSVSTVETLTRNMEYPPPKENQAAVTTAPVFCSYCVGTGIENMIGHCEVCPDCGLEGVVAVPARMRLRKKLEVAVDFFCVPTVAVAALTPDIVPGTLEEGTSDMVYVK